MLANVTLIHETNWRQAGACPTSGKAMPNYRRAYVPGGTFFFTVVTCRRHPLFADEMARQLLGNVLRECQKEWPFEINAIVLLHDHLHAIWTMPRGDTRYSARWSWIKKEFTSRWLKQGGREQAISKSQRDENRRGIWQRRFWEHTLEDEDDFERHFDYIHFNPVKHGYVNCPHEWEWSSFHRWVKAGVYPWHWACFSDESTQEKLRRMSNTIGEPE